MKEIDRIVRLATEISADIIRFGGEVSRAEDTASRICLSLGAKQCDVFAISSFISVCAEDANGEYVTLNRRIKGRETDLGILEILNGVSRGLCNGEIEISEAEREIILNSPKKRYVYVASMLVCLVFTLYFGGGLRDACVAAIAALSTVFLKQKFRKGFGNAVVFTFVCSFVSGLIGAVLVIVGFATDYSVIAKGDIMLLVPGVSLVCAGRDVIGGELLTGILGFTETILIAVALAAGYALPEMIINKVAVI